MEIHEARREARAAERDRLAVGRSRFVRAEARRRWVALALIGLLVGVIGAAVVTSVAGAEAQCLATYVLPVLPGGQISGQALIVLGDPAPYAVAITGGSGKYKGVEGEVRVDPASETQPRGVLTFHLEG